MSLPINKMILESDSIQIVNPCILNTIFYCENILEQIFKFLPMNDLLTSRLVCKTWKSECDRTLKLRSFLILLRTEAAIQSISKLMDKRKAQGCSMVLNKFVIQFNRIHLEQVSVKNFLDNHGSSFQHLGLQFNWGLDNTKNTPQSFKYLLEKQVPNLKSLEFFGFSEELWQAHDLFGDCCDLLPKLEYIGCFSVRNYRHALECPLYLSVFSRIRSIKKVAINCSNYWNILLNHAVSNNTNPLRTLLSKVEEISMLFPKLLIAPEISKYKQIMSSLSNEQCQPINESKILALMPQVCTNVRTLRLCFARNISKSEIGNLLIKYATQLEELWMNDGNDFYVAGNVPDEENQENQVHMEEDDQSDIINEFFQTAVFQKLRVICTAIDIFSPSNTATRLFHKQLPVLESLTLNCNLIAVPKLVWDYKFNHSSLQALVLNNREYELNAECLLPLGEVFPNIRVLHTVVPNDNALRLIVKAFPNLEELTICGLFTDDGITAIGDLKRLRNLGIKGNLTEDSISWLQRLKSIIFLNFCKQLL